MKRSPVVLAALLVSVLAGAPARGDDDEAALQKGKKLYDDAVVLLEAKKYAEACPKLEEAVKLVPVAVGARIALAECDEGRGRFATALAGYKKAQSLAANAGQADREKLAKQRAAALEGRVATLRVEVSADDAKLDGLTVQLDERALDEAARGAPIPVDAGKHVVRATAKGRAPFEQTIDAVDGKEGSVTITLAAAGAAPSSTAGAAPGRSPLFYAGIAGGALGVVALGVGGAMGGLAASKNDESFAKGCVKGGSCTPAGAEARQAAYDFAAISTAMFIGGGVLAAAGVTLVIVGSGSSKPAVTGGARAAMTDGAARGAAVTDLAARVTPGGIAIEGHF